MHQNDKVLIITKILKDIQLYLAGKAAIGSLIDISPTCSKTAAISFKPIKHYKRTVVQLIWFPVEGTGNKITWTGYGLVS